MCVCVTTGLDLGRGGGGPGPPCVMATGTGTRALGRGAPPGAVPGPRAAGGGRRARTLSACPRSSDAAQCATPPAGLSRFPPDGRTAGRPRRGRPSGRPFPAKHRAQKNRPCEPSGRRPAWPRARRGRGPACGGRAGAVGAVGAGWGPWGRGGGRGDGVCARPGAPAAPGPLPLPQPALDGPREPLERQRRACGSAELGSRLFTSGST